MKKFKDFYGATAGIYPMETTDPTKNRFKLKIYTANGKLVLFKHYTTERGAKIAMGKYGECWKEITK